MIASGSCSRLLLLLLLLQTPSADQTSAHTNNGSGLDAYATSSCASLCLFMYLSAFLVFLFSAILFVKETMYVCLYLFICLYIALSSSLLVCCLCLCAVSSMCFL